MKLALSAVAIGISLTATAFAGAQPPEATPGAPTTSLYPPVAAEKPGLGEGRVAAPKNALELSVGTSYTQGFGNLKGGVGLPSVVTPGLGVDLGVGYRIDPHWAVLASGQYQEYTAERTAAARGVTGTLAAQYHVAPMQRLDPWVEVGTGYRLLWEDPSIGPTALTHGFQLGRVRLGLDYRAGEAVSIGPVVGADATMFVFQDIPGVQTNISDPRVSTFIYAGLQGRFDIGGSSTGPRQVAKR